MLSNFISFEVFKCNDSRPNKAVEIQNKLILCYYFYFNILKSVCFSYMLWLPDEESKKRCQAVFNRLKRAGYLMEDFKKLRWVVWRSRCGALQGGHLQPWSCIVPIVTSIKNTPYHLRPRAHNFELPVDNNNLKKFFFYRMLYSNSY